MKPKQFLDGRVTLYHGDCLEVLAQLPENSVDSVVCDPPYHLQSIHKRFAAKGRDETSERYAAGPYGRTAKGFMGKQWDGGDIAFRVETWIAVLRVLKPGGHLVAFSGTRTYHRMACAIEDAGFEIRDQIGFAFGSGFPKSHDAGNGWGTALKPAWEPICLARKALEGTVVQNVLKHGTGAINIDGCRIEHTEECKLMAPQKWDGREDRIIRQAIRDKETTELKANGRWPANLCHDGSEEVLAAFPQSDGQQADISYDAPSAKTGNVYGKMSREGEASANRRYTDNGSTNFAALPGARRGDDGSAARFFYTSKADGEDRLGSKHPTVKPLDLAQWLCRLVTPPKGTVLDIFAGTGTTGEAAWREGMDAILIEREAEYVADIERRMELAVNPTKRAAVAASKNNLDRPEDLPLFSTL
jgi:site-specific DNA-methyltransferase (adenine-specific)